MERLLMVLRQVHEDESGHIEAGVTSLVAGVGGIVLGIGAASDSDVASIAGGVVLGLGVIAAGVVRHRTIDWELYHRIEELEKK